MDIFTLVAEGVILLTICVVVMAVCALLSRWFSERAQKKIRKRRTELMEQIRLYLDGKEDVRQVMSALRRDSTIGHAALLSVASELQSAERWRLYTFFEQLRLDRREFKALMSRSWMKRARAANHMAYLGTPKVVPLLIHALDDAMLDVRLAAAQSLAQVGARQAVIPILRALALPAAWPLQRATEVLVEMGNYCLAPLRDFVRESTARREPAATTVAIRVLGMLRDRQCVPFIIPFLKAQDPEMRLSTARALGDIGDPRAISPLCSLLDDTVWTVRSAAVQSLGKLADRTALPALAGRLGDSAWWVRFNAAQAVCLFGQEGADILTHTLRGHSDGFARDISRQVLEEHGWIGLEPGVPS
ncbi:HEAT repeat domain-containing protein [Tahibacter amnicola]|uniref:HEAT repeat domain-containing protein n=1 Tax=Tahibacter amnicola TaxID=2976241 RepID=A0ABY6BBW3_9GAMM|nr:HEAT repeat domain-containing protein [Tahibacter amnicola]UXI66643.1 HEAT repeat domain-containing protein [Tahibacter amnicola]